MSQLNWCTKISTVDPMLVAHSLFEIRGSANSITKPIKEKNLTGCHMPSRVAQRNSLSDGCAINHYLITDESYSDRDHLRFNVAASVAAILGCLPYPNIGPSYAVHESCTSPPQSFISQAQFVPGTSGGFSFRYGSQRSPHSISVQDHQPLVEWPPKRGQSRRPAACREDQNTLKGSQITYPFFYGSLPSRLESMRGPFLFRSR